jgi:arylsulfatase A-like enzyme
MRTVIKCILEPSFIVTFTAMVDKLDESVGLVVEALAKTNMLQNSIIFFGSDNGASPEGFDNNYGSNWPLRGVKTNISHS